MSYGKWIVEVHFLTRDQAKAAVAALQTMLPVYFHARYQDDGGAVPWEEYQRGYVEGEDVRL